MAEIREYQVVRLVTDEYQDIGLAEGEVGTVVDIMANPNPRYMVEFHEIPPEDRASVQAFDRDEIELMEDYQR